MGAGTAVTTSSGSSGCGGGSSSSGGGSDGRTRWGLPASLAAAVTAGAYTIHHKQLHGADAAHQGQQLHGRGGEARDSSAPPPAAGFKLAWSGGGSVTTTSSSNSSGNSSKTTAVSAGGDAAPRGTSDAATGCPEGCSTCRTAARLYFTFRCLERGTVSTVGQDTAAAEAVQLEQLESAAQQQGITIQEHLQQRLLLLAWRHPVPYVCGNALCEGTPWTRAVWAVRGGVGTLCGGCGRAWYCCEGCQRQAWPGHWVVCKRKQ
jgi:hypothetical protein